MRSMNTGVFMVTKEDFLNQGQSIRLDSPIWERKPVHNPEVRNDFLRIFGVITISLSKLSLLLGRQLGNFFLIIRFEKLVRY